MTFLQLIIVGFLLYLAETYIPMSPPIKIVLRVLVVLWILSQLAGLFGIALPKF